MTPKKKDRCLPLQLLIGWIPTANRSSIRFPSIARDSDVDYRLYRNSLWLDRLQENTLFPMQAIEKRFGATVRKIRERQKLSQEAFADKAGIHRTYVSAIELGKVQVSISIADKLATALDMPLSRLFRDVESSTRDT